MDYFQTIVDDIFRIALWQNLMKTNEKIIWTKLQMFFFFFFYIRSLLKQILVTTGHLKRYNTNSVQKKKKKKAMSLQKTYMADFKYVTYFGGSLLVK